MGDAGQCRGEKFLLKSGARTEFLLFKSKLLSGQKTISKWLSLVPALPINHSLASPSGKLNKHPNSSKPSALSAVAYASRFLSVTPSIHADCRVVSRDDQHLPRHSMLILKGSSHQFWISIKGTFFL